MIDYETKDDKLVKEYKAKEIKYIYVQVIAMVNSNGNYEIVSYGSIFEKESEESEESKESKESNWWKFLLIGLACLIFVGVMIFLLIFYLKKKRDINKNINELDGPMISRHSQASKS